MSALQLLVVIVLTVLLSWWLVGRLIVVLKRLQIVDTPNDRTLHAGSVPRGGGLVIVGILLAALLLLAIVSARLWLLGGLAVTVLAWACLGWWDDRHDLSARVRLLFQLLFAYLTLLAFGSITILQLSSQAFLELSGFGAVLSFMGVIWLANLYNFMDGIDGLAATQTVIAGITLAFWFWQVGDPHIALCCLVLAAASYGFLLWNWQPARIFMGDVGSVTIGAFFATLIIYGNTRYQLPVLSFVLLLGVFVFDASVTVMRRASRREKIWLPHRSHFYQRLANTGIEHASIVIALTVLMLICSLISSFTVMDRDRIGFGVLLELLLLIGCAGIAVFIETKKTRARQSAETHSNRK